MYLDPKHWLVLYFKEKMPKNLATLPLKCEYRNHTWDISPWKDTECCDCFSSTSSVSGIWTTVLSSPSFASSLPPPRLRSSLVVACFVALDEGRLVLVLFPVVSIISVGVGPISSSPLLSSCRLLVLCLGEGREGGRWVAFSGLEAADWNRNSLLKNNTKKAV